MTNQIESIAAEFDLHGATVLPATAADRVWLEAQWRQVWGDVVIVSRGQIHYLDDVDALIAWRDGTPVGEATYFIAGNDAELTSMSVCEREKGIGAALLQAAEIAVRAAGASRIWMIKTNDNLDALRFYQKRGYRLRAVHTGAVDRARSLKTAIPMIGAYGIPVHDEIELETFLRINEGRGRG